MFGGGVEEVVVVVVVVVVCAAAREEEKEKEELPLSHPHSPPSVAAGLLAVTVVCVARSYSLLLLLPHYRAALDNR